MRRNQIRCLRDQFGFSIMGHKADATPANDLEGASDERVEAVFVLQTLKAIGI